jgi:predicted  nucleic acid-binding Zn-ribbon protein
MLETEDLERIIKAEKAIEVLKSAISKLAEGVNSDVDAVRADFDRISKSTSDRATKAADIASENKKDIADIRKAISGDGEDEPGIRTTLKLQEGRLSTLELDKRDRSTVLSFWKAAWGIAGTLVFGLVVASINSTIAEKAKNAATTQADNKKNFENLENKVSNNNGKFFESINKLNEFKAATDKEIEWIKRALK